MVSLDLLNSLVETLQEVLQELNLYKDLYYKNLGEEELSRRELSPSSAVTRAQELMRKVKTIIEEQ
jgi:hypothetical protein